MCILKFFLQFGPIEHNVEYVFCENHEEARKISEKKIEEGFVVDIIAYDYVSGM